MDEMLRRSRLVYKESRAYMCVLVVWDSVVGQICALLMHPEAAAQKQRLECHRVPAPLCHIACVCRHAYDSCVSELQKKACPFEMKRKELEVKDIK